MKVEALTIAGVFMITGEAQPDDRGSFTRLFDREELRPHGVDLIVDYQSVSCNAVAGTLRGMHYQVDPHPEHKVVGCSRGALYDVVIDLRRDSPTHLAWLGVELTEHDHTALYVPPGIAHGFVTLIDDTEVTYLIGGAYEATAGRGVRWDDPRIGIEWPRRPSTMSERDATYADLESD